MNALSASDILTRDEILAVLAWLRKGRHRRNTRQNEIVFRLATSCGLRCSEICKLNIRDVMPTGPKPCIRLQKRIVKGKKKMRTVPLWWDESTRAVLEVWIEFRKSQGAGPDDPVVIGQQVSPLGNGTGKRRNRSCMAARWKAAIRALGKDRVKQLSIHCGRHTFASHALNVGRSLVEVRDALGHSDITMTSRYSHLIERENVPDLYSKVS